MEPRKSSISIAAGAGIEEWQSVPDVRQLHPAGEVTVTCYDRAVPAFVEAELERLYAHIHSTLLHLRIYGAMSDELCTYVARRDGEACAIFLFRREGQVLRVLNQSMPVSGEEMDRFAACMFERYSDVRRLSFHAVLAQEGPARFPYFRHECSEDIAISLPASPEAYLASLGKNMRRNLKRYGDRLLRSFPSYRCEVFERGRAEEAQIRAIIGFNRARMAGKNKVSELDEEEAGRIVRLTRASGLISVATIDGRICAGGIAYRVGDSVFLNVIAHDPAYDDYWIGILTCYHTILESIGRGARVFNFLWGRYDYKFALGSVLRPLEHVDIYRSRLDYLRQAPGMARIRLAQSVARAKFGLLEMARRRDTPAAHLAYGVVSQARRLKRQFDGWRGHGAE